MSKLYKKYGKQKKDKMQTNPYGIEDRKIKTEKLLSREDSEILRKAKGIGLYASPKKEKKVSGIGLLASPKKNFAKGGRADVMPARNKKNFRPTKSGAGMTRAGVAAYRRANPGSKLKTAVTGKVKPGSKAANRRKSYCARSAGQMKKFPKAAKDPNSRLRQARRRWKC